MVLSSEFVDLVSKIGKTFGFYSVLHVEKGKKSLCVIGRTFDDSDDLGSKYKEIKLIIDSLSIQPFFQS